MSGGVTGVERDGERARVSSQDKGRAASFYTTTLKGGRSEENGGGERLSRSSGSV